MPFLILSHLILKTTSKASIENHVSKIQLVNYAFTGNFKCSRKNVDLPFALIIIMKSSYLLSF